MRHDLNIIDVVRYAKFTGYCPLCGNKLPWNPYGDKYGQHAHFITATIPHYKRYGKAIVDSYYNGIRVCSLACNNAVAIRYASRPLLCDRVADIVAEKIQDAGR